MALTTKHFVKIDNIIYALIVSDPIEKEVIAKKTKEFFKILTENQINDPLEIHLTVGDFNSHIGNEQENHVTSEEWRYIPRRLVVTRRPTAYSY